MKYYSIANEKKVLPIGFKEWKRNSDRGLKNYSNISTHCPKAVHQILLEQDKMTLVSPFMGEVNGLTE